MIEIIIDSSAHPAPIDALNTVSISPIIDLFLPDAQTNIEPLPLRPLVIPFTKAFRARGP